MDISIATFISTFLFSTILICILALLLRSTVAYSYLGLSVLGIFSFLILLRLLLPLEFYTFTITIPSLTIMPFIKSTLLYPLFHAGALTITPLVILLLIWILGTFVYIYHLVRIYKSSYALKNLPITKNERPNIILSELKVTHGIKKSIHILQSRYFSTPALVGIKDAIILLPDEDFTDSELYYIISHELYHYKKHDNFIKLLLELLNALHWWNPVFYLLKCQISTIIEFRADAQVIEENRSQAVLYMDCLLGIYKRRFTSNPSSISVTFCATGKKDLEKRFLFMIHSGSHRPHYSFFFILVVLCLFASSFSVIFEAAHPLEPNETNGYIINESDSVYILKRADGRYFLHFGEDYFGEIESPNDPSLEGVPIYTSKEDIK